MQKRKCSHCGYSFKPKEQNETICEPCRIQLRDDSSGHKYEFDVKCFGLYSFEIKGKMILSPEKLVFNPNEVYLKHKKTEIELSKIKDAIFSTEKEISPSRAFWLGVTFAVLNPIKHNMIRIDYDDESGITQHLIFEGKDIEKALKELNELRKNLKD